MQCLVFGLHRSIQAPLQVLRSVRYPRGSKGSILNAPWMRFWKHEKWWKIGFHNVSYGKICGTSYINVTFLILLAAVKQQNSSLLQKSWKLPTWKTIHRAILMIFTSPGPSRDDKKDDVGSHDYLKTFQASSFCYLSWGSYISYIVCLQMSYTPKIKSLNQFSPPKKTCEVYQILWQTQKGLYNYIYIINLYIYIYTYVYTTIISPSCFILV